jgi:hypothetical protein
MDPLPKNIRHHRMLLFQPPEEMTIAATVFDQYWPHVSNVWQGKGRLPSDTSVSYYCCRKKTDAQRKRTPKETGGKVMRKRHYNTEGCDATLQLRWIDDGRTVVLKPGTKHSHDLDSSDVRSVSLGLKVVLRVLAVAFESPAECLKWIQEGADAELYKAAGSRGLTHGVLRSIVGKDGDRNATSSEGGDDPDSTHMALHRQDAVHRLNETLSLRDQIVESSRRTAELQERLHVAQDEYEREIVGFGTGLTAALVGKQVNT